MNKQNLKVFLVVFLVVWVFIFSIDSMFGIDWPSYTIQRIFIWSPTVLIGIYWLVFGGDKKEEK
ncbi:MAG: hypothetical protein AUK35_00835 [Zetaproteobacteria bacterium CG2_30_46_52]|nr:MAG: hypothetical protein AUK35_00835 [Zetaproteobacteria bacterium CG2_30_46_52]